MAIKRNHAEARLADQHAHMPGKQYSCRAADALFRERRQKADVTNKGIGPAMAAI